MLRPGYFSLPRTALLAANRLTTKGHDTLETFLSKVASENGF